MELLSALSDFLISFVGFIVFPYYIFTRKRWARKMCFSNPMVIKATEQGVEDCKKAVVLCVGDSLTEGSFSFDWIEVLENQYPNVHVSNKGASGQVSERTRLNLAELLKSYDTIAAATLWIGTNDVIAAQTPQVRKYNEVLTKLAAKYAASVLDIHAEMERSLVRMNPFVSKPPPGEPSATSFCGYSFKGLMAAAILVRMMAGSLDLVARAFGRTLLFDDVHLSEKAGAMLLDLLRPFLDSGLRGGARVGRGKESKGKASV
eukprot:jgi/Botrbrau1/9760/Bobra.85_1s0011.1